MSKALIIDNFDARVAYAYGRLLESLDHIGSVYDITPGNLNITRGRDFIMVQSESQILDRMFNFLMYADFRVRGVE